MFAALGFGTEHASSAGPSQEHTGSEHSPGDQSAQATPGPWKAVESDSGERHCGSGVSARSGPASLPELEQVTS